MNKVDKFGCDKSNQKRDCQAIQVKQPANQKEDYLRI